MKRSYVSFFLLCMEYLSRMFCFRTQEANFQFHPKYYKKNTTPLDFADDLLVFKYGEPTLMGVFAKNFVNLLTHWDQKLIIQSISFSWVELDP